MARFHLAKLAAGLFWGEVPLCLKKKQGDVLVSRKNLVDTYNLQKFKEKYC